MWRKVPPYEFFTQGFDAANDRDAIVLVEDDEWQEHNYKITVLFRMQHESIHLRGNVAESGAQQALGDAWDISADMQGYPAQTADFRRRMEAIQIMNPTKDGSLLPQNRSIRLCEAVEKQIKL